MILLKFFHLLTFFCLTLFILVDTQDDLYKLLGISKTATTREIRQAFKKLALVKHPDKNTNDPTANENFIKINRAYEILKDEELRKKYDLYGEKGLHDDNMNRGSQYQSWNFYNQNFGIYDDDPQIITLSRSDFTQSVDGSNDIWFINYYSGQCSHCHDLAPNWRELAKQLDGVVRIGAVNCMDDWMLCNEQRIPAFPTLIVYPKRAVYAGEKSVEAMMKFALSFTESDVFDLSEHTYEKIMATQHNITPWFISYCLPDNDDEEHDGEANCLDEVVLRKLSIMLNGLVNVGTVNCNYEKRLCALMKPATPNAYYKELPRKMIDSIGEHIKIDSTEYKDVALKILSFLPDVHSLDAEKFKSVIEGLKEKGATPWLIQFTQHDTVDLELKKLPALLKGEINFGRVDCSQLGSECAKYQITKYPTFVLLKRRNLYEHHYGRQTANDLAVFARENAFTNVKTLASSDFPAFLEGDRPAFVDFFAPWCPPCMHLLPQFRKAAKKSGRLATFGTVDCTIHTNLCEQYNVRSYPTTILFNNTIPHQFHGQHNADDLVDFINDILNPSVYILTYDTFQDKVGKKEKGKLWLVDFFASWCGPCQQLAPEWRKLAKKLINVAFVGQVDCVTEPRLCQEQNINSYPHIRLYPTDSEGAQNYQIYNNQWWRDVNALYQWASQYLPSKTTVLDSSNFERLVIKSNDPWILDFYAPWCGHCQVFAPIFEEIAGKLEGKVKCGKINCQDHGHLCQRVGIQAYPTIRYYAPKNKNLYGEDIQNQDANFIINFVKSRLPNVMIAHDEF